MNSTIVKALRAQAADLQRDKTASVSDTMGSWPARFADALGSQTRPMEHWGPVAISTAIQSSSRGYDTPGAATTLRPSIPVSPPVVSDAALTVRNAAVGLSNKTGDNGYALHVTEGITRTDELWCLRWGKVHSSGTDGNYTYVDCYECDHADGHPTAISDVNVRVFIPSGTTIATDTLVGYLRDRDGLAFWVGAAAGSGSVGGGGSSELVFFQLKTALSPGTGSGSATAYVVEWDGDSWEATASEITVYDVLGDFCGAAGARGFATVLSSRYLIVNMERQCRFFELGTEGALTPGSYARAYEYDPVAGSKSATVYYDVYDEFGCFRGRAASAGVDGSRGIWEIINGERVIVNMQPHAQVVKAAVNEAGGVATTDSTFDIDTVSAFLPEGSIIVSTPTAANNYFDWEIADDGLVLLGWNGTTWDTIQAECPY